VIHLFRPNEHWNVVTPEVYAELLRFGYGPDRLRTA
jgi:hypothetical protein